MADAYFLTADSILSTDVAVCLITSDANLLKNSSSVLTLKYEHFLMYQNLYILFLVRACNVFPVLWLSTRLLGNNRQVLGVL